MSICPTILRESLADLEINARMASSGGDAENKLHEGANYCRYAKTPNYFGRSREQVRVRSPCDPLGHKAGGLHLNRSG